MTQPPTDSVYDLIRQIRTAFNRLKSFSDAMICDLPVTAAMRAVLEHLDRHGPGTVPQIARAKSVTRQHIQLLADALSEAGLVRFEDNPGHKRSKLLVLTETGQKAFADIRTREERALADLGQFLDPEGISRTTETLNALNDRLSGIDPADY